MLGKGRPPNARYQIEWLKNNKWIKNNVDTDSKHFKSPKAVYRVDTGSEWGGWKARFCRVKCLRGKSRERDRTVWRRTLPSSRRMPPALQCIVTSHTAAKPSTSHATHAPREKAIDFRLLSLLLLWSSMTSQKKAANARLSQVAIVKDLRTNNRYMFVIKRLF